MNDSNNIDSNVSTSGEARTATPRTLQVHPDAGSVGRIVGGDGNVSTESPMRITAADLRQEIPGNVISTARTTGSGGRPAVVGPNDIVTVGGFDMTVKTATAMGYLRITESGGYAEAAPSGATEVNTGTQAAQEDTSGAVPFEGHTEANVAQFAEAIPSAYQDRIIGSIIAGKQIDSKIASSIGMDPQVFTAGVEHARAAFVGQASAEIEKMGVDPRDFAEWANENMPEAFQTAMRHHVYGRDPKAYTALVQRYLNVVPPSHEALAAAGLPVTTTRQGVELITIKGVTMSRQVASRLGFI